MRSTAILLFGGALVVSAGWAALGGMKANESIGDADTFPCTVASITDGDTLRCTDGTRVRLSGIAARERDGSCSPGHPCPVGSAEDATAMLEQLADGDVLSCKAAGETYGRIAAFCTNSAGVDLSCAMVESGTAAQWDRYWGSHRCEGN